MPHPIIQSIQQKLTFAPFLRVRDRLVGIAQDFWKDGKFEPPVSTEIKKDKAFVPQDKPAHKTQSGHWHANAIQIAEHIWGDGRVLPGGDDLDTKLTVSLGINKGDSLLDLAAGLGILGRKLSHEFGAYVTGMEPDAAMAAYGMELAKHAGKVKHAPVTVYDPAVFKSSSKYNCVLARELFYRVADKRGFFTIISKSMKPHGQLAFTDYILEAEDHTNPAIAAWLAMEGNVSPYPLSIMTKAWSKLGFDVRVNEDRTVKYRHAIMLGLAGFALFLSKNPPDDETRDLVKKTVDLWATREAALANGLKFYRFHAIKN